MSDLPPFTREWALSRRAMRRRECSIPADAPIHLYALVASDRPRHLRYIGITGDLRGRLRKHRSESAASMERAREWKRELAARGATIEMVVLRTFPSRAEAHEREWRLINRLRRRGLADLNVETYVGTRTDAMLRAKGQSYV